MGTFTSPQGGLRFDFNYDCLLDKLPAYQTNSRTASLLNPLFEFLNDGNYQQAARAIPSTLQQGFSNAIPANQTYEDQISVPAGSFLTMIGGVQTPATGTIGGYRVRMFDVGSKTYLSDDFVHGNNVSGQIQLQPNTVQFVNGATLGQLAGMYGMYILVSPYAVTSPGQLNIQITNLAPVVNTIEMAFYFAVPTHDSTRVYKAVPTGAQVAVQI